MIQLAMARPKEGTNTTYVPVTNASTIAIMAHKMNLKARKRDLWSLTSSTTSKISGINRWIKTAELDSTMDMVSVIINAVKAAFFLRNAEPRCDEPSPLPTNPPGIVIYATNVTVVMSAPTTKWALDAFFNIDLISSSFSFFFFCSSSFVVSSSL
jgi:hypothetical protein